jgi:ribonucleoside-diphosphate reductase alpha chain
MKIQKRNGDFEKLSFDKITARLRKLANDKSLGKLSNIDPDVVAQKVVSSIYDGVKSNELDEEAARIAITMIENPEFPVLASRIVISNLHKNTFESFSETMELLYDNFDSNNNSAPILSEKFMNTVRKYTTELNELIVHSRDYLFEYFGFKTLEKAYLMRKYQKVVERPQHMYIRICVNVLEKDGELNMETVKEMYDLMSQHFFTMASPTIFNSGSPLNNLASCFLLGTHDSIDGMYKTIADCARISKVGGGIGLHMSNIRAKGSVIRGTNGISDGIIPMLKVYNSVSSHVNQCILPGIKVYSKNGLVNVENVTTSDHLLTSDGTYKQVNEVIVTQADVQEINWKNKKIKKQKMLEIIREKLISNGLDSSDEMLEVEYRRFEDDEEQRLLRRQVMEFHTSANNKPLVCTSEHDIYIIPATKQNGYFKSKHQLKHNIKKPEFTQARNVKEHDLIGYPIPKDIIDQDFDLDHCYQMGLTTGFTSDNYKLYMNLPDNKTVSLLKGVFDNGCVNEKINAFYLITDNINAINVIRFVLMRLGVLATYDNETQIRFPKLELFKTLNIFENFTTQSRNNTYLKHQDFLWTKIRKIDKVKYTGPVYDFNMIDNHNYVTEHGLVHNSGKRKGSFACFIKNTKVSTTSGVKNIQDVCIGDSVVTHNNKIQEVTQVHKNKLDNRTIYKVCIYGGKDIFVTGNHKFLSHYKDLNKDWNSVETLMNNIDTAYAYMPGSTADTLQTLNIIDYKNILLCKKGLVKLEELSENIITPNLTTNNGILAKGACIKKSWVLDETFSEFLGMWFKYGCLRIYKNKTNGISFSVMKNEFELIEKIKKHADTIFGLDVNYHYFENTLNININSRIIGKIFKQLFGNLEKLPNLMFKWGTKMIQTFLKKIDILSVNENIKTQLFHLCRSNGIKAILNSQNVLEIEESDCSLKIESITPTDLRDEYVYTLGVNEDHSYNVEGVLVENCYLEPWHADVLEFLDLKRNQGHEDVRARDLFYAVWTPDLFMKQVENDGEWYLMCPDESPGLPDVYGDEFEKLYWGYVEQGKYRKKIQARDIWKKMLDSQIETGVPYITYKDAVNKKSNQKNIGVIKSSNLCVAPETMILTSDGYFEIKTLENQQVKVWNGEEWSDTTIKQTGENQELIKISLSNGSVLECTPYHKFYIEVGNETMIVDAINLKQHMKIIKYTVPVIQKGSDVLNNPYNNGLDCGHGNNYDVPLNCTLDIKLKWFAGYIDGTIDKNTKLISTNYTFLKNVKYMLQTMGCNIQHNDKELFLTSSDAVHLYNIGLRTNRLILSELFTENKENIEITSIEHTGRISDTYCFTESKRNMGMFNGVLTGNCNEIVEYSDDKEYATCNLCSISLPKFVKKNKEGVLYFDHQHLYEIAKFVLHPMNNVIDNTFYPTPETKLSNTRHRPIAVGVQGTSDVYIKMRLPFESPEAKQLNKEIFETLYYGCISGSIEEAKKYGTYSTYQGSPMSQGKLQFDLWEDSDDISVTHSGRWDWSALKQELALYGVRNSLLTGLMPTASSASLMGNTESFEIMDSCIFKRRVLAGEFMVVNKYLVADLMNLGLWDKDIKDLIIANNGSVQGLDVIPSDIQAIYKTVWEISMKSVIEHSADRGVYIDQTQSMNLFMQSPSHKKLSSMLLYGFKHHLKTGLYYLRSKSSSSAGKFTIDPDLERKIKEKQQLGKKLSKKEEEVVLMCSIENPEDCLLCSS